MVNLTEIIKHPPGSFQLDKSLFLISIHELEDSLGELSIYRSIIMIIDIPDVNLHEIVEQTIIDLKLKFVEKKLMLGEFHSGPPNKGGIRNPDFKPLWCPLPLLVIREMVETDVLFLKDNPKFYAYYQQFAPETE